MGHPQTIKPGDTFNRWTAVAPAPAKGKWLFRCACGTEKAVNAYSVKAGVAKSCGCLRAEVSAARAATKRHDLTGREFGRLAVIGLATVKPVAKWRVRCSCGTERVVSASKLLDGHTRSCGCLARESSGESVRLLHERNRGKPGHRANLTGATFGRWTVLEFSRVEDAPSGRKLGMWRCRCSCGEVREVRQKALSSGRSQSCGCLVSDLRHADIKVDLTGHVFGRLRVVERAPFTKGSRGGWVASCECGNAVTVVGGSLMNGSTRSCGCLARERSAEHMRRVAYERAEYYAALRWMHEEAEALEAHKEGDL